jgi:hypothetical protein
MQDAIAEMQPDIDLLVVGGTVGGVAAKSAAAHIRVVFISVGAPVDIGLVESLAHPGGNMTGTTFEATSETYDSHALSMTSDIHSQPLRMRSGVNFRFDCQTTMRRASTLPRRAAPGLCVSFARAQ